MGPQMRTHYVCLKHERKTFAFNILFSSEETLLVVCACWLACLSVNIRLYTFNHFTIVFASFFVILILLAVLNYSKTHCRFIDKPWYFRIMILLMMISFYCHNFQREEKKTQNLLPKNWAWPNRETFLSVWLVSLSTRTIKFWMTAIIPIRNKAIDQVMWIFSDWATIF